MRSFDAIVVGIGGMGSAALYEAARRGARVLGIEQFGIGHTNGSSHGESRIIRRAYFEHPDYVPLVDRSFELWGRLEAVCGVPLLRRTGLLLSGPRDGAVLAGVLRARNEHGLAITEVQQCEYEARFPGFRFRPRDIVVFEREAGILFVEECVVAFTQAALELGARLETGETVRRWSQKDHHVAVETDRGCYLADRLIITGGPWTAALLADLRLPLQIHRRMQMWFRCEPSAYLVESGSPVFCFDLDGSFYYGFPALEAGVIKVAEHRNPADIDSPAALDREIRESDVAAMRGFLKRHLPAASADVVRFSPCMYTMTPDEHFILDRHPDFDRVCFAAGFSGHGFKFAPIIGSILADLSLNGSTAEPCAFLRLDRPALRGSAV